MNNNDISKAICDAYKETIKESVPGKNGRSFRRVSSDGIAKCKDIQEAFFEDVLHKDYSKLVEHAEKMNGDGPLEKSISVDIMDSYLGNL